MLSGTGLPPFPPPPIATPPTCLNGLLGETNGGVLKLNTDELPGPFGVAGSGPGEAVAKTQHRFESL